MNDTLRGLKFAAVGVTAVGAFSRAITVIKDFETNMARVRVITDATPESMAKIEAAARGIGETTRFSASEAASGFQYLGMAGLSVQESMETITPTMNLAGAAMIDVGRSADILTNVMAGFRLETSEATRVADVFAQASRSSNQTVEELYEGVVKIAPAYTALGLSVEQAATDMSLLANSGVKASEAGTALAGGLSKLLRQPPIVAKALDGLGVSVDENKIKQIGLIGVIQELRDAGIDAKDMSEIFGLHWKTAGALVAKTDEEIQSLNNTMNDSTGVSKEMSENGIGAIDKSIKLLMSALDELWLSLGEGGLAGALSSIIDGAREVILYFKDLSGAGKVFRIILIALIPKIGLLGKTLKWSEIRALSFRSSMVMAKTATMNFGRAIKTALGPLGLILLAVEGLTLAYDLYGKSARDAKKAQEEFEGYKESLKDKTEGGLSVNKSTLNRERAESKERLNLLKKEADMLMGTGADNESLAINTKLKQIKEETAKLNIISNKLKAIELEQLKRSTKLTADKQEAEQKAVDLKEEARKEEEAKLRAERESFELAMTADSMKFKNLEEYSAALKALNAYKEKANFDEIAGINNRIKALTEEKKLLEDISSSEKYNPSKMSSKSGVMKTADIGVEAKKIDIGTPVIIDQLKEMKGVTQEVIDKVNELNKTSLDKVSSGLKIYREEGTLAQQISANIGLSMASMAEDGSAAFGDMANAARAAAMEVINTKLAEAIAGLIASELGTKGVVGLATAAAGSAAVVGLFNSLIPSFETGGIVPGASYSGDNVTARVNSGEMVLNRAQQTNLFRMANKGTSSGVSDVNFKIKGANLVGAIKNNSVKRNSFS
jgi:TP901 family phage tail tape measure protein